MELLTYTKDEEFRLPSYLTDLGNFNNLPTPFTKCDFTEFYRIFVSYSPSAVDFRQLLDSSKYDIENGHINYRIYFYGTIGYAVGWDYDDPSKSTVYRLGCSHQWELITNRTCYRKYRCSKCGCEYEVDSSD